MSVGESELPTPPAVERAREAMEMARIWIVDGDEHVVISPNLWEDPAAWGLVLADLAKHVAAAYEAQGHERGAVLERIHDAFEVEWGSPTDSA
jgi:hypothetical protein